MESFVLANVITKVDDFLEDVPSLIYNDELGTVHASEKGLEIQKRVGFHTYFNAFSASKWKKYCGFQKVTLKLWLSGDPCRLEAVRTFADGSLEKSEMPEVNMSKMPYECSFWLKDTVTLGFSIISDGTTVLEKGHWEATPKYSPNNIELAVATTTFKKEEYIIPNIQRIKDEVLGSDSPVAQHFHLYVIDNGQTLDVDALSDEGVTVVPNPNTGGSGGFARGMIEALESPREFTHVVLMDDDVRMDTESFKRLYALLSCAKTEYANAAVNGAMLELENPSNLFEDVSVVRKSGGYSKIKPDLDVSQFSNVARSELIDVEVPNTYGAWWFSCIPTAAIEMNGLPMPFFVRCDDVEYGRRCNLPYMTMNGICVWHSRFEGRFRANVDCYQYVRNMMATIAIDGVSDEKLFMARFSRTFDIYMRQMAYSSAELWLDGLEDYLEGPMVLALNDGAEMMMEKGKKNEKMIPFDQIEGLPEDFQINRKWIQGRDNRPKILKLLETVPHDRHYVLPFLLSDKPGQVQPQGSITPWTETAFRKSLVVVDTDGEKGSLRQIDYERNKELRKRYSKLMKQYAEEHEDAAKRWQYMKPQLTSVEWWKKHLGIEDQVIGS